MNISVELGVNDIVLLANHATDRAISCRYLCHGAIVVNANPTVALICGLANHSHQGRLRISFRTVICISKTNIHKLYLLSVCTKKKCTMDQVHSFVPRYIDVHVRAS